MKGGAFVDVVEIWDAPRKHLMVRIEREEAGVGQNWIERLLEKFGELRTPARIIDIAQMNGAGKPPGTKLFGDVARVVAPHAEVAEKRDFQRRAGRRLIQLVDESRGEMRLIVEAKITSRRLGENERPGAEDPAENAGQIIVLELAVSGVNADFVKIHSGKIEAGRQRGREREGCGLEFGDDLSRLGQRATGVGNDGAQLFLCHLWLPGFAHTREGYSGMAIQHLLELIESGGVERRRVRGVRPGPDPRR